VIYVFNKPDNPLTAVKNLAPHSAKLLLMAVNLAGADCEVDEFFEAVAAALAEGGAAIIAADLAAAMEHL